MNAHDEFKNRVLPQIVGVDSNDTLQRYASQSRASLLSLLAPVSLSERQKSAAIGYGPEYFATTLGTQLINEKGASGWSCERVTRDDSRMSIFTGPAAGVSLRANCVLFNGSTPKLVVQCFEYLDPTRLREAIGDGVLLAQNGPLKRLNIEFAVFAHVWETSQSWRTLFTAPPVSSVVTDLFIVRNGKRTSTGGTPMMAELRRFRDFLEVRIP